METAGIMIVEDEEIVARDIENILKGLGYSVTAVVASGEEAVRKASETRPDLVLMDILLKGDMDGVETAEIIRSRFDIPIIYLTAYTDDATLQRAKITEPYGYIIKPFEERELRSTIEIALYRRTMEKRVRESERRFKNLVDSTLDGVYRVDAAGNFTSMNQAGARIFGHDSPEEIIGRNALEYWRDTNDRDAFREELKIRKAVSSWHIKAKNKEGKPIELESSSRIIEDENGTFLGIEGILRDVTGRMKIEEALKESQQMLKTVIDTIPVRVFWKDHESKYLGCNKQFALDAGLEVPEDLIGRDDFQMGWREQAELYRSDDKEVMQSGIPKLNYEEPQTTPAGSSIWLRTSKIPLRDINGEILGVLGTYEDITESKKMEEDIFRVKRDWEDTFNTITDMITVHDKDFNIIHSNKAAEKMLSLPSLELEKVIKCYQYYHGTECPPAGCPSCDCLNTGKAANFELFEPHLNMFIEIRAIPRFDSNGQLIGLIHVVRDITERRKAEDKVHRLLEEVSKAKIEWELTFDSVTEIIVLIDKEFNILRCNRSCADFCGMPVITIPGHKFTDLFPWSPEDMELIRDKVQKEEPTEWIEIETTSGRWFYVGSRPIIDNNGVFLYSVIIATDITGLKNAQKRLGESEEILKERVKELEKFYEMAVGRELKMKELKKEIERLKEELAHYGKGGR
ncbi:MAG TPA: PAS domain S-box protein [Thermodesulfovibrionales bacterium]|nr:PAS domain S-box protein [Thermodesulfovibrionales bacterium]